MATVQGEKGENYCFLETVTVALHATPTAQHATAPGLMTVHRVIRQARCLNTSVVTCLEDTATSVPRTPTAARECLALTTNVLRHAHQILIAALASFATKGP